MKHGLVLIFSVFIFYSATAADTLSKVISYDFILMDTPAQLFTMKQFNTDYLSAYRLLARGLNSTFNKESPYSMVTQIALQVIFMPMTHEEGHRSILTAKNIGSISQPYFNSKGAAYVKGVTDSTLKNLRDTDLPAYVRLNGAGIESDYMMAKREETLVSLEQEDINNLKWDYYFRKIAIIQYYASGLLKYNVDIKEEDNELDRDIVGYDTYGAARHLFRPKMEFKRYTNYSDLTTEEQDFVNRMGIRSLLNLLNPNLIGISNFSLTDNIRINAGLGYTIAPFGDFIDENIWLKTGKFNLAFYARQFENRQTWFQGYGLSLANYEISENWVTNAAVHFWQQPKELDFNTSGSFMGGAVDLELGYLFPIVKSNLLSGFGFSLGLNYKTKGYLPEEVELGNQFGVKIGMIVKI